MHRTLFAAVALVMAVSPGLAQQASPELEACRASSLIALRETVPDLKSIHFDEETLSVSKANTKVEDTPVTAVIIGDAYLQDNKSGRARRFVCLIGEKGKVLLTYFTRN